MSSPPPGILAIMPSFRIAVFLALALLGLRASAAERPPEEGEHDFEDAIVVFTLEYEDDLLPAPPWALAGARIRRLGNLFFLTGTLPEGVADPVGAPAAPARRYWIPLADVVRMAEYDDVESALEALELGAEGDDVGRPVVRGVSDGPRQAVSKRRRK